MLNRKLIRHRLRILRNLDTPSQKPYIKIKSKTIKKEYWLEQERRLLRKSRKRIRRKTWPVK